MSGAAYIVSWAVSITVFSTVVLGIAAVIGQRYVEAETSTIRLTDTMGQRVHKLSGVVMVPSGCHDLDARVHQIDAQNYLLIFQAWEDPNRVCNSEDVARQFHLTVFAPSAGISFQATVDGMLVPLQVTTKEQ